MKKMIPAISSVLVTLALGLCLDAAARQGRQSGKEQARASLEASLDQLERGLKEGAALAPGYHYPQTTRVRLKRSGGCNVSFRVSKTPGSLYGNDPRLASELDTQELRVNLSGLDPASVELLKPNGGGNFLIVRFSALGGKEAIRRKGSVYNKERTAAGQIDVEEKAAPQVAEALRQAITACKE